MKKFSFSHTKTCIFNYFLSHFVVRFFFILCFWELAERMKAGRDSAFQQRVLNVSESCWCFVIVQKIFNISLAADPFPSSNSSAPPTVHKIWFVNKKIS
jgi:hypothetical protein